MSTPLGGLHSRSSFSDAHLTWHRAVVGRSLACLALWLSGCQLLFPLGDSSCPIESAGPPGQDFDGDFQNNEVDNCPVRTNVDQADEDQDGVGDACDLCPVGVEVNDQDCDGVGDSCDPDDTRPDTHVFEGFNSDNDLELFGTAEVVDGRLSVRAGAVSFGLAITRSAGSPDGLYEMRFEVLRFAENPFATIELRFAIEGTDTGSTGRFAWLLLTPDTVPVARLVVGSVITNADDTMYMTTEEVGTDEFPLGTYTLRLEVELPVVRAQLFGPADLFISLEDSELAPTGDGTFGFVSNFVDVDVDYVSQVRPRGE
jgi:hypothetical protein